MMMPSVFGRDIFDDFMYGWICISGSECEQGTVW